MKYMEIRTETQKILFFQILNLKTKAKIKPDVANIFYINIAEQAIVVERLYSFVCCADKALPQHLGLEKY